MKKAKKNATSGRALGSSPCAIVFLFFYKTCLTGGLHPGRRVYSVSEKTVTRHFHAHHAGDDRARVDACKKRERMQSPVITQCRTRVVRCSDHVTFSVVDGSFTIIPEAQTSFLNGRGLNSVTDKSWKVCALLTDRLALCVSVCTLRYV